MVETPALTVSVLLTLAVLVVNGWTDAPNAIAGAVVTGALSFRRAVALAAVCNFLGVLCVTAVYPSVVETIYSIAAFGGGHHFRPSQLCRGGFGPLPGRTGGGDDCYRALCGGGWVVRHPHQ